MSLTFYRSSICHRIIFDHLSASGKSDPGLWTRWVPAPECFHPEHDIWRNRSPTVEACCMVRKWCMVEDD